MFYFFGSKRRLAPRYDVPAYGTIVEPFAGAAAYSIFHLASVDRVLLYEKDPRVVELWQRLMAMEPEEVLALPVPSAGDETADFLHMTAATSNAIGHSRRMTVTKRMPGKIPGTLAAIARVLPEAREKVQIILGDYRDVPDLEATWFVDPPYVPTRNRTSQGMGYGRGCTARELDYRQLAQWCRERKGQVIVCEQEGAGWLPFRRLAVARDSLSHTRTEVVWTMRRTVQERFRAAPPPRSAARPQDAPSTRADRVACSSVSTHTPVQTRARRQPIRAGPSPDCSRAIRGARRIRLRGLAGRRPSEGMAESIGSGLATKIFGAANETPALNPANRRGRRR